MIRIHPRIIRAAIETLEQRRLLANSIYAYTGADGHMLYKPQPLGDHIEDYSNVGYMGGTVPIPDVPTVLTISPVAGDDEANIEAAIATVAAMPLQANGFRGAIFLNPGEYDVAGTVNCGVSGIVLRGAGAAQTIIRDTGTDMGATISFDGGSAASVSGTTKNVIDKYVPVGARTLTLNDVTGYAVGDTVIIHRPSTQQWINDMGMNLLTNPWTPGSKDVNMERTITRIDNNVITLDAPLVNSLDLKYTDAAEGTNTVYKYNTAARSNNVGIEYIGGISSYDPLVTDPSDGPVDENHAWDFIDIRDTANAWVRGVRSQFFAYACVHTLGGSKWVTVTDSECLDPVSQITGGRRYSFANDDGTYNLFKNLYTREGRHDYVEGSLVVGPNTFVDSRADATHADAGPHHRWSTGVLWDNLYSGQIAIQDRGNSGTGHGHAGANQVIWNSNGTKNPGIIAQSPATAQNWVIGNTGIFSESTAGPVGIHGPALIDSQGTNVLPRSLYYQQLGERMAYENFSLREVRLGDADAFVAGDPADAVPVDAAWKSSIQAATGKTAVNFDDVTASHLVPFTFNYALDPGTNVVGASLSLGLKSTGSGTSTDRIYFENATRSYSLAELGVPAPTTTEDGVVIDLSRLLAALQDGKLNLAILGNSAVDWATLNFQTASTTQRSTTTINPAADAYVQDGTSAGTNFGTATSLQTKLDAVNNQRESFLRFDLSSLAGYVVKATVRLVPTSVGYGANVRGNATGAMFNQISFVSDDTWSEAAINWNNKPASDAAFDEYISKLNAPLNFDVTSLVQAALAGDKKLSMRLASIVNSSAGQINYGSRENSDANLRPQLILETFANAQTPVADAYVRDGGNATLNFGTAIDLAVKVDTAANSGNNRDAYLKFDLNGVATAPAGATLRLVPFAVGAPQTPSVANFVTDDSWTETGITWNTRPGFSTNLGTSPVALFTPSKFDLTSQVASTIAGDKLLSLRVSHNAANSGVNQFAAREWADAGLRPLLVLKNLAPQITSIQNVTGAMNTASGPLWFGIADAETAAGGLAISATSSNTTLLPNANISFGGSGGDRTFTLTPAANQTGASTVTITVTDAQGQTASAVLTYSVNNTFSVNGDANPNTIRVVRNGSFTDVYIDANLALHQDYATSPQLLINGLAGNDSITVDYTGGNPIPAAGLTTDGGADNDVVTVLGNIGGGADAFSFAGGNAGITGGQFAYANAEELDLVTNGGADTINGVSIVSAGAFVVNVTGAGGSLAMASGATLPSITDLVVNSGTTFNLNGQSPTIDGLSGAGTVNNNGAAAATLTVGESNGTAVFSGALANGSSTLALTKDGTGKLTLSGTNTYTGLSTINAGIIEAATSAAFVGLSGQVRFGGGMLHVTGNSAAANIASKFTTSYTGATTASTGTFDIDAGVTLTIGGSNTSLQTNGGGSHGGVFTRLGAGTLRIVGNNGQLDDPFKLNAGTVVAESATALGGADNASNHVDMKTGTTLILKQDAATNFLTPISVVDAGGNVNVVVDRQTAGAGVTHSVNALTSVGAFTLNLSAGSNVTSGTAGLSIGTVTLSGDGTFNITGSTLTVPGVVGGAFGLTKSGAGMLVFNGANTYIGTTTVNDGVLRISNAAGLGAATAGTTIAGGAFTGRVEFVGDITVAEPFTLANRSSGGASAFLPHLLNVSGNNTLSGNIALTSGGSFWTIQSDAGLLTLAGNLTNANTTNTRTLYLRGAGAGQINGQILQTNVSLTQLNKEDAGTWTINGAVNYTGATNVNGGTLVLNIDLTTSQAVNIAGANSVLVLSPSQTRVIKTGAVSVTAGGRLDLKDNKLIVTTAGATGTWNGSTYTGITGLVASGRNGGGWGGSGIVTTMPDATSGNFTTLAVAKVADFSGIADADTRLFAGQTVHGSDTVVMYTYGGDATLDGKLNVDDYGRIDFNAPINSSSFANGDFNYDGRVNVDDYGIIDFNVGIQGPQFPTAPASAPSAASTLLASTVSTKHPKRHIG